MRRVALGCVLAVATMSCVSGSVGGNPDGGCEGVPLAPIEESAAAVRASCVESVNLAGTLYVQWGCQPVRRGLLGPVEAGHDSLYLARSIDDVPTTTALAIRGPSSSPECSVGNSG